MFLRRDFDDASCIFTETRTCSWCRLLLRGHDRKLASGTCALWTREVVSLRANVKNMFSLSATIIKPSCIARHKGQQKPPKVKIAKGGKNTSFPDCTAEPDSITAAESADQSS